LKKPLLVLLLLTVLVGVAVAVPTTCGVGPGDAATAVEQRVTQHYGTSMIGQSRLASVPEGETVMRLLQREFEVKTRYGGGFVQSIEGFAGGRDDGRPVDWFYYVNGIESSVGAATRRLAPGDRVWWDRHDWGAVQRVPAVVGSFPEPFRSGLEGRRRPVRIDCADGADRLCDETTARLQRAGVSGVARARRNSPAGPELLRIVVGPWSELRGDPTLRQLERSPRASGVFAQFRDEGRRLALFDERGEVVRELGAGAGLIAAARFEGQQPIWVVTGTDVVGVSGAAAMLQEDILARRFALAVEDGQPVALPVHSATDPEP
jgi:hypothetical protein